MRKRARMGKVKGHASNLRPEGEEKMDRRLDVEYVMS